MQRPTTGQARHLALPHVGDPDPPQGRPVTKMSEGKVFVVYHGAGEIDALSGADLGSGTPYGTPNKAKGRLLKALQSAKQAIASGAVV